MNNIFHKFNVRWYKVLVEHRTTVLLGSGVDLGHWRTTVNFEPCPLFPLLCTHPLPTNFLGTKGERGETGLKGRRGLIGFIGYKGEPGTINVTYSFIVSYISTDKY